MREQQPRPDHGPGGGSAEQPPGVYVPESDFFVDGAGVVRDRIAERALEGFEAEGVRDE